MGCRLSKKVGTRGWPDRLFLCPDGAVFWVEFKAPGGSLSKLQEHIIAQMRDMHQVVAVYGADEKDDAWTMRKIDAYVRLHGGGD